MSIIDIQKTLLTELNSITPTIDTAYANYEFIPTTGVPYQVISFLYSRPINYIQRGYIQQGFMQVDLMYPTMLGAGGGLARAELLRSKFKSGDVYSSIQITATPEIKIIGNEDDRFKITVFVNFSKYMTEI